MWTCYLDKVHIPGIEYRYQLVTDELKKGIENMYFKNGHYRDYEYKSQILNTKQDLLKLEKQVQRTLFLNEDYINNKTGEVIMSLDDAKFYDMTNCNNSDWIECHKINHASYNRTNRLRRRINEYLSLGNCLFLTLTFNEETMNNTNSETRKKYVKNYLKSQSNYYVANIDFGKQNGREHYHAVIVIPDHKDKIDYSPWNKKCGHIDGERVRYDPNNEDDSSCVKLAKYVSKLTNHAIKNTTKRSAIIYSKLS